LLSGTVTPASWDPALRHFARPLVQIPPKHPWIALTFDDGPHPIWTERLLEVLHEQHVSATFFVVGKMAERHPEILGDIARQGHEIENHTYNHPRLSRLDNEAVISELAQTRAVIRRVTGRDSLLFRPPGGAYTRQTIRATSKAGYKMILWNVLTNDVEGATRTMMRKRILQGADDGAIVLMHSGVQSTIDMLPEIIAKLRERGYHFVTVSTLLGMPEPDLYLPPSSTVVQTAQADVPNPSLAAQQ
jgi:peptidoglycan-N-acetylglucosamine deacetylase